VARDNTRLLRRTRTSAYLESAFGALASPPSGEMRLPNVREGEGSPEDLGGTLAPDSNPTKDGHFRRHRQRCPNAPGRRRRGHLPEPDFAGARPAGVLKDRCRVILNTTPLGRIYPDCWRQGGFVARNRLEGAGGPTRPPQPNRRRPALRSGYIVFTSSALCPPTEPKSSTNRAQAFPRKTPLQ
jgi:hypothetical protein